MLRLIINPHASRGHLEDKLPRLLAALQQRGMRFSQHVTRHPAEVFQVAQGWDPLTDTLLAVGGDGTVQSVAKFAVQKGFQMGIVPFGSANDFASCLGWSTQPDEALRRLTEAVTPVDLGVMGEEGLFVNGLGMGFDALAGKLSYDAPAYLTGMPRYLWAVGKALKQLQNLQVQIVADGREIYAGPSFLVSVMNSTRYGGGFKVAPQAHPADGLLDIVIGKEISKSTLAAVLPLVVMGQHTALPYVMIARAREVTVRWERPQVCHLDGEMLQDRTECQICIQPAVLQLQGRLKNYS
ncbi:diacylglycerol/lipid kinase family protein [Deinococcus cellulosilyticus]|uniref:Diacylglycerol kinase n=1 Tax=Deinococcus cellulosilyticus (strain DSM 18568 / NBRC 106333 / KACC 11606 / 5516J-15) TaxID=1223518 RepID=A0A511N395_DEIC1|nr:diacylglycerol kinase family protein [Deinococcus cellulosilyticus]GEM47334.1 diacylglycerol kinase [Deinococcus cellulosilyticus NBRC 106333 = KACC 11606]